MSISLKSNADGTTGALQLNGVDVLSVGTGGTVDFPTTKAIETPVKEALNAAGTAPVYGCRAWVNFNGTRNVADTGVSTNGQPVFIRASGNVTSVVKNSAGDYTVNFTTAMPDANYAAMGVTNEGVLGNRSTGWCIRNTDSSDMTTTSLRIDAGSQSSGTAADQSVVTVSIFR